MIIFVVGCIKSRHVAGLRQSLRAVCSSMECRSSLLMRRETEHRIRRKIPLFPSLGVVRRSTGLCYMIQGTLLRSSRSANMSARSLASLPLTTGRTIFSPWDRVNFAMLACGRYLGPLYQDVGETSTCSSGRGAAPRMSCRRGACTR